MLLALWCVWCGTCLALGFLWGGIQEVFTEGKRDTSCSCHTVTEDRKKKEKEKGWGWAEYITFILLYATLPKDALENSYIRLDGAIQEKHFS